MFPEFNATTYFIDLLALSLLLIPAMALINHAPTRRTILTLAGAYLLYFIAPRLVLFYAVFWVVVYLLHRLIVATTDRKLGTPIFWFSIIVMLAPMIIWKLYFDDFSTLFNLWSNQGLSHISQTIWTIDLARAIIIPIGLSFATFRGADLLVKSWVGKFKGLPFTHVLYYGFFPPVQIVGPIIEYEEINKQQKPTADDIYQGLMRIAFGLIKVLILAAILQKSAVIFQTYETAPTAKIWGFLFIYTWFFYLNFSGYSDLAIGAARTYGFKLKENFAFPYFRPNISEFWNNWHMSLSRFAQRNAYVPLGGYRKKTQYVAIFATIFVIALWHDLSLGMILFACYHGAGLIAHRYYSDRKAKDKKEDNVCVLWGKIFGTYLFVTLSFPLLVMPLDKAGQFYLSLVGIS